MADLAEKGASRTKPLRVLSLGAGVQSSTLALLIAHGTVAPVDCAIFADTQWEPREVYDWLNWLEVNLPFPVYRVSAGSIRDDILAKANMAAGHYPSVPWHIQHKDGSSGMGGRQCTRHYKIRPMTRKKRELLGVQPRQRLPVGACETLLGISIDEATRAKSSRERWNTNLYPLLDLGMSRADCLAWMQWHGYPRPPKSSCIGCPFHSDGEWRRIRDSDPDAWADALAIDEAIRQPVRGMRGLQYMHSRRLPLAQVDLSTPEERGQVNMFENECEGMCGL